MSKNNVELVTIATAASVAVMLNDKGIGGGVVKTYEPDGSIFGPTSDPTDPEAKFWMYEFANSAKGINAGLIQQTIVNNPVRWIELISEQIQREGTQKHPDE